MAAKTTEQFIAEAKAKHGDRYDYSKTVYTSNKAPVIVIDTTTGEEFSVQATSHLTGGGRPTSVKGSLARTCNICGKMMVTPSKDDLSGFIQHGDEEHPNFFLNKRYEWTEKKYFNPINQTWYGSRKYLARSLKELGISNEEYYTTHGKEYMPEEWHINSNDPKFGDAPNQPFCLETGETVKFDDGHWCYPVFASFSASTTWHAKNTDRIERAMTTIKEKAEHDPTFQLRPNQLDYWVVKHGMSIADARSKVKERQTTNSLEAFIERAGGDVEAGKEAWAKRQEKWLATLESNGWFGNASKVSGELFDLLAHHFQDLRYGKNELNIRLGHKVVKPDCIRMHDKKCIEFFGDYFHANPANYDPTHVIRRFDDGGYVTAQEIWERDSRRLELMKEHGYDVLVVWEKDYRNDRDGVLLKCIQHLM